MNAAFTALTLISLVMLTYASPATAFPTMLQGVMNAITLIVKLAAIYAVWLSVLKMMQATGLDKKLSKLLRPLIKRLFKGESDETYNWISVNLAGNMLGMGGVATHAGIKAMKSKYDTAPYNKRNVHTAYPRNGDSNASDGWKRGRIVDIFTYANIDIRIHTKRNNTL